jgi:pimeloyl-ACP methyl ester carboxylesterase
VSGSVQVHGATLFYEEGGAGGTLILIHGGLASGVVWQPVAERLEDEFRVVRPDSRGHGRSSNPTASLSYTQLADDIAALVDALELERPIVAGWSDGGQVTMELGVRHPGVASALVIGGAYPDFVSSGLRDAHRKLLAEIKGDPTGDAAELAPMHDDWPALLRDTERMWLEYAGLSDSALSRISEPVLVLAGDRDELIRFDLTLDLRRRLAGSELAVCPAAGHSAPMTAERAAIFAAVIGDFARRHAPAPIT